jgi:hypothetical protein
MVWNNLGFVGEEAATAGGPRARSIAASNDLLMRNARMGESEDSETDSEDEGYDSDVKREHSIDYNKSIFINEIKRPSSDTVQKMYSKINASDKR